MILLTVRRGIHTPDFGFLFEQRKGFKKKIFLTLQSVTTFPIKSTEFHMYTML